MVYNKCNAYKAVKPGCMDVYIGKIKNAANHPSWNHQSIRTLNVPIVPSYTGKNHFVLIVRYKNRK